MVRPTYPVADIPAPVVAVALALVPAPVPVPVVAEQAAAKKTPIQTQITLL